jgi:tetratricopeptide (TPR) repeat protein
MSDAHADEIAKLEALYADNPEGRVFTHLAEAYRKAGELERARDVLLEGIERHPDYSSAHVVLGRVLRGLDQGDEAESEFLRVLELDSHNLIALRALGDLARDRGDDTTALSYYERLVELEPSEEVQEAIAALTSGEAAGEESDGDAYVDPWASVPVPHDLSGSPAEPDQGEPAEPEHELMDIAEFAGEEEVGETEFIEEPSWSTEADTGDGDDYGGWVGGGPEDQRGDAVFDEVGDEGGEHRAVDGPGEELAAGGGPFVGGLPDAEADAREGAGSGDTAEVTTETIAQVYARQGLYDRAADVYRELLRSRPDDEGLRDRLAEMEQLASAREERSEEEPMAVSGAEGMEEEQRIEGFEAEEVDLGAASAEPIAGLEVQDADPETGLIVEATPEGEEGGLEEAGVSGPTDDSPWASPESATPTGEEEDETLGSVWTGSDWGEAADAETPHAWADEAGEPDDTPPIREYFGGLLSWSGAGGGTEWAEGAVDTGSAPTSEPEAPFQDTGGPGPESPGQASQDPAAPEADAQERDETESMGPSGAHHVEDEDDDDDLDMFRSWLESLKQ